MFIGAPVQTAVVFTKSVWLHKNGLFLYHMVAPSRTSSVHNGGALAQGPPASDEWRRPLLSPWLPVQGPVACKHLERLYSGPRDPYRGLAHLGVNHYRLLKQAITTAWLQQQCISHGCGGWGVRDQGAQ